MKNLLLTAVMFIIYQNANAQVVKRFDIVIDEILADPSPSAGLPMFEFIELKNTGRVAVSLKNWKIGDETSTATIRVEYILQPDSFLILCGQSAAVSYNNFGSAIGISNFPSLDNEEGIVILRSDSGQIIHAVKYKQEWFENSVKQLGGWSLEMIDIQNPCSGHLNWIASVDNKGGTPGKKNSVDGLNPDDQPPVLIRSYTIDSNIIVAVFDESLDSVNASIPSNFILNNGIGIAEASMPVAPIFQEIHLRFSKALKKDMVYSLTAGEVTDCSGNKIGHKKNCLAGIPQSPDPGDIIINEILFDPEGSGYDYVEIYNRNDKIIDCAELFFSNREISGNLTSINQIISSPYLLFPGDFLVISENSQWLEENYHVLFHESIIQADQLPSFPNDRGTIVLINRVGERIDEVHYDEKWHFALLENTEGISLERINYKEASQNKNNWTSAASTAGYGTPSYQNSQFRSDLQMNGTVTISPLVFSPDNDGVNDIATIQYQLSEPGYTGNITIFDITGRPVVHLSTNALLGLKGNIHWDGLDNKRQKLAAGIYIVVTEIFNLGGKRKKFKNIVTLARRFK